ncbi:zinc ABC transporter solute-binding protein [Eggerthellaceae bacterium zg-1084]|uniref:metal ABC transporter solute-binding protein, Zn/Mn family n=1 Tax=Berryella wangjianweii TaxID=2734634 RepID=UPI001552CD36|nr:zinc ABC transporter substrate-binding protein [Berryella wangjianweii]NPD30426.1 zinc ABC transporter solute-binding protein [Berryella wangjianweii]
MDCTRRDFLRLCGCTAAVGATGALLTACGGGRGARRDGGRPLVYASFYPVYDLVREVAGDSIEVRAFMPTNKDPHIWEPTPKNLRELSQADLLVINGANMERWIDQVRSNLPDLPVLTLADSVELITYRGAAAMGEFQYIARLNVGPGTYGFEFGHTHQDIMRVAFFRASADESLDDLAKHGRRIMNEKGRTITQRSTIDVEDGTVYALEMGHESGYIGFTLPEGDDWVVLSDRKSANLLSYRLVNGPEGDDLDATELMEGSSSSLDKVTYDPHSWLSLANAKLYCNAIYDRLGQMHPSLKSDLSRNKVDVVSRITELSATSAEKFKSLERREFVVTHNAYAYLCRDLNIKHFPLQGLTSTESPALKTVRKAVDFCRSHNTTTIFYELGSNPKDADTVANEIGGKSVPLASMEYVSEQQGAEMNGYVQIMRSNIEAIYESLV